MEKKNKQFFRTVTGKFLLFLIINIMLIISFGCVCASVACVQEDLYGITEEEFYQRKSDDSVYYNVMNNTENLMYIKRYSVDNLSIQVTDVSGNLIVTTTDFNDAMASAGLPGKYENSELYTYDIQLVYGKDGSLKSIHGNTTDADDVVVLYSSRSTRHSTSRSSTLFSACAMPSTLSPFCALSPVSLHSLHSCALQARSPVLKK